MPVAGDETVNPPLFTACQQMVVVRIILNHCRDNIRLDQFGEFPKPIVNLSQLRIGQVMCPAQVRIAKHLAVFGQDGLGYDQLEGAVFPQINDPGNAAMRGEEATDDDVGIKYDAHAYCRVRRSRVASSTIRVASSSLRPARSAVSRICWKNDSRLRFHLA